MKRFIYILLILLPIPLLASEGEESFFNKYFWFAVVNFTIYVGMLYYFLKKPTLDFFKNNREKLKKEMEESERFLNETRNELAKYKELMEHLDEKIQEIKDFTIKTEEKEVETMLKAAESYAAKMKEDAKRIAQQEVDKAIQRLRDEVAEVSTKIAEESLKKILNGDIQDKLVDEVVERLKEK